MWRHTSAAIFYRKSTCRHCLQANYFLFQLTNNISYHFLQSQIPIRYTDNRVFWTSEKAHTSIYIIYCPGCIYVCGTNSNEQWTLPGQAIEGATRWRSWVPFIDRRERDVDSTATVPYPFDYINAHECIHRTNRALARALLLVDLFSKRLLIGERVCKYIHTKMLQARHQLPFASIEARRRPL